MYAELYFVRTESKRPCCQMCLWRMTSVAVDELSQQAEQSQRGLRKFPQRVSIPVKCVVLKEPGTVCTILNPAICVRKSMSIATTAAVITQVEK